MKPTPVEAFRVAVENGRVALEFGASRDPAPAANPVIALSDRVVLEPRTAARLLHALREALERLPKSASRAADGAGATGLTPGTAAAGPAALLLEGVRSLGVPYQFERSFRMSQDRLQPDRFLVTVNRSDLGARALERTLDVGRQLGMPDAAQAALREHFDFANCVHFGFEGGEGAAMCKIYLERKVPSDEAGRAAERGEAALLHLAFKWAVAGERDVPGGSYVVSRYDWYPALDAQGIAARLRHLYAGAPSLDIALDTLAIASARVGGSSLQYLEVDEPGSGRRSFDLNLYDAGLAVRDLRPVLLRMRDLYAIAAEPFQALFDQAKDLPLGHLAGGTHRDGRDFFNVYYGVTGFPLYADRLR